MFPHPVVIQAHERGFVAFPALANDQWCSERWAVQILLQSGLIVCVSRSLLNVAPAGNRELGHPRQGVIDIIQPNHFCAKLLDCLIRVI